ncbi:MAG: hypothetical protein AAGF12_37875 [Myxococcota bacterium]
MARFFPTLHGNRRASGPGGTKAVLLLAALSSAWIGCSDDEALPEDAGVDATPDAAIDAALDATGDADSPDGSVESPPVRYRLVELTQDFDADAIPDPLAVDYDDDGIVDQVSRGGTTQITIELSASGAIFEYVLERPNGAIRQIRGLEVLSLREDGRFPSIVLAEMSWGTTNSPSDLTQHLILNREGTLETVDLGHSLIGRDVSCRWFEPRGQVLCFYASYGYFQGPLLVGRSRLISVSAEGAIEDLTGSFGLPYPVRFAGFGTDGYHMIGADWVDTNGDGADDIVAVGQHSRMMVATMSADEAAVAWLEPSDDQLRIWTARNHDLPCAYVAIEHGMSVHDSDFVQCYDREAETWYTLPFAQTTRMTYDTVVFWDQDGAPETVEFAARRASDMRYGLYQLVPELQP